MNQFRDHGLFHLIVPAIQIALQDQSSCDHIHVILTVLTADSRFHHGFVRCHSRQSLIPEIYRETGPALQLVLELFGQFHADTFGIVHVLGKSQYDLFHFILDDQFLDPGQRLS